mmetsp:Transcript_63901/g.101300  ORF Transcript_63901/g.101300 Transcript_63901/m.101300 type:complete len:318 (-) Transcript_63901:222-1175(-)
MMGCLQESSKVRSGWNILMRTVGNLTITMARRRHGKDRLETEYASTLQKILTAICLRARIQKLANAKQIQRIFSHHLLEFRRLQTKDQQSLMSHKSLPRSSACLVIHQLKLKLHQAKHKTIQVPTSLGSRRSSTLLKHLHLTLKQRLTTIPRQIGSRHGCRQHILRKMQNLTDLRSDITNKQTLEHLICRILTRLPQAPGHRHVCIRRRILTSPGQSFARKSTHWVQRKVLHDCPRRNDSNNNLNQNRCRDRNQRNRLLRIPRIRNPRQRHLHTHKRKRQNSNRLVCLSVQNGLANQRQERLLKHCSGTCVRQETSL